MECVHQMLANLIRSQEIQSDPYVNKDDPWGGILTAAAFTLWATYHTTLKALPGQLVFGCDMILPIQHQADWMAIK